MWARADGVGPTRVHAYPPESKGGVVVHWMDGWDWAWMSFMMVFWVVVLGAVIYAAVRLAQRPPRERKS